jgi:eukaryotic translation initiation factor 2C
MLKLASQLPDRRAVTISNASEFLMHKKNEYLEAFGVQIGSDLVTVDARVLKPPTLDYSPQSEQPRLEPRDGSWNMRGLRVKRGITLSSWSVVLFGTQRDFPRQQIDRFVGEATKFWSMSGLTVLQKNPPIMWASPTGDVEGALREAYETAGRAARADCQLIACILPNTGEALYARIKRTGDTVLGVVTQW